MLSKLDLRLCFIVFFLWLVMPHSVLAQEPSPDSWLSAVPDNCGPEPPCFTYQSNVIEMTSTGLHRCFTADSVYKKIWLETDPEMTKEQIGHTEEVGKGSLLNMTIPFEISGTGGLSYTITNIDSVIYNDFNIEPQQPDRMLSDSTRTLPWEIDEQFYATDEFWPAERFSVTDPYIIDYVRGVNFTLNLVRWNPVTKQLIFYTRLEITISYSGEEINPITFERTPTISQELEFAELFPNHQPIRTEAPFHPSLLIIMPESFQDWSRVDSLVNAFIAWKRQIGFAPILELVPDDVSCQEIQLIIHQHYFSDNEIGYVQFIGGHEYIPMIADTLYSGSYWDVIYSDHWYTMVHGNDAYPDLSIGRFSTEENYVFMNMEEQLIAQLSKALLVDQDPLPDHDVTAVGITAHREIAPENPYEFRKAARLQTFIAEQLGGNLFSVDTAFGMYENGTQERMWNLIHDENGLCDAIYDGHGGRSWWWHCFWNVLSFTTDDMREMTNEHWPRMWGFACEQSPLQEPYICISEAAVFNPNGGALTYLGGTANTSYEGNYHYGIYLAQGLYQMDIRYAYHDVGSIVDRCKIRALMSTSGCQRKCAFWYVLLGDVTSKIRRTNNPLPLGFVGPTSFCEGLQEINLSVECMGMMVEDAIVTLLNVADSSFVAQQTTNGIGEVTIYGDIPAGDYLATVSKNDYLRGTHIVRVREAFGPHSVLARVVLSDVILSWLSPQPAEDCIGDDVYFRVMFSEQLGGPYELLIDTENLWYNHHNAWLNHRSGFYHITAHDGNIPLPIDFVPTPSGPWPSTLPMHRPAQE